MSGHPIQFQERLLPSILVFVICDGLLAMLAIAFGSAYGPWLGWAGFAVLAAGANTSLFLNAPIVQLTPSELRAGPARLPRSFIGTVTALSAHELRTAQNDDARIFLQLRPWHARTGVLVENTDPDDPHPSWLLTARDPDRLVRALHGAKSP